MNGAKAPRTKGKPASTHSAGDFRFINVRLDKTDAEWLEKSNLPELFPLDFIFDLVESGYKVSFSYDAQNNSALCTITDLREGSATFHAILSGRGATPVDAWYAVAYRHYVLLGESGWDGADTNGVTQRWR